MQNFYTLELKHLAICLLLFDTGVAHDGSKEEFVNESQTIADLNLFAPLLKLVERHGNMEEKRLKFDIAALIGR